MTEGAPLGALVRLFLRLGFSGFGGPLVHIALMETEVVERRKWLSKEQFLEGLSLCQMLPGPASTQLGVLICYLRGGLLGGVVGGAAFVLPGFSVMLALTLLYARYGALPGLQGIFLGIGPAVIAVIGFSAWRLGRAACTGLGLGLLALAGFLLTALLNLDTVIVLLLCGGSWAAYRRVADGEATLRAWTLPLLMTAGPEVYARLAWLWLKMGALVYGGGYVIIPVVRGEAVRRFGWLSDRVFLDGLALGQVTPGPIVNLSVFVGYQKYFTAARELGEKLARRGWRLVYGGGSVGLMGVLSRAVLAGGGHVTGVIPKALLDLGVGERGVSELIVTDGLRDRKAIMDERGDAFVALPGGLGTLEEVLEVLTLKQLGYHTKPVVVL